MINSTISKIFVIQQNNLIYFACSNMLGAYNFLVNNVNPADKKLVKSYKQYTLDFKKTDTIHIPSVSGQMFQFKIVKLYSKYNSKTSVQNILKTA